MARLPQLAAVALVAALCFAQKPKADLSCHIGSAHKCRCPRMVARHNATLDMALIVEQCNPPLPGHSPKALADQDRFRACLIANGVLEECEIIAKYDAKHPEDNCKSACKADHCSCHDGPPCTRFAFDIDRPPRSGDYGSTEIP